MSNEETSKKVKISVNFNHDFFVNFDKDEVEVNDDGGFNWEAFVNKLKTDEKYGYKLFFDCINFDDFLDNADDSSWKLNIETS